MKVDAIDIMVEEHSNIEKMLEVIRDMCIKVMNEKDANCSDFHKVIDFVRNYADKHHHSKEEAYLFPKLSENSPLGKATIEGMLVEHDLGRLYIGDLEKALISYENGNKDSKVDIIANAMSYTYLLKRHIFKENNALYKFARNNLSKEALEEINEKCKEIEKTAENESIQGKYIDIIGELRKSI